MLLGFDTRLQGRNLAASKKTPELVPQIGDGPVVHGCRRSPTTGLSHPCELYRITMFMVLHIRSLSSPSPPARLDLEMVVGHVLLYPVAGAAWFSAPSNS